MTTPSGDPEVIYNRIVVKNAEESRDVASILGLSSRPSTTNDGGDPPSASNEDTKAWLADNEIAGSGMKSAVDEILSSRPSFTNNLLETMLGKKAAKQHLLAKSGTQHTAAKPRADGPTKGKVAPPQEDSDEDEGRAGMFKSRSKGRVVKAVTDDSDGDGDGTAGKGAGKGAGTKKRKAGVAGGSYLDQLLAEKGARKKNRK